MKLVGQAFIISKSTYSNKKGEEVQVITLGDYETFEKITFFNVPISLEVPEAKSSVEYEISLREYKNKQGFNQLSSYLNNIRKIDN